MEAGNKNTFRFAPGKSYAGWIILGALVLLGILVVAGYNSAVSKSATVEKHWADIDAQLQRRFDLIPNLVETVKGYAQHEQELFTHLADVRTKYFHASGPAEKAQANSMLGGAISRLLLLQERYPDLKANQNFLTLQAQLEGTENRIGVARIRYNEAVRILNTYQKSFFGRFFCSWAGVGPAEYFKATEPAATTVPKVDFSR